MLRLAVQRPREPSVACLAQVLIRLPAHPNVMQHAGNPFISQLGSLVIIMREADDSVQKYMQNKKKKGKAGAVAWVLDVGLQLARGLAHAHTNKIVHQDVSPGNALLFHTMKFL